MNAAKRFRILSIIMIVFNLLLGTSLNMAYAQDFGSESTAEQVSLSGWLSITWGDSKYGESSTSYSLTDENGQRTILQIDDTVAKKMGGILQFNGRYVNVQGTLAATPPVLENSSKSSAPAIENYSMSSAPTPSSPAVLNVISINPAQLPRLQAPTIDGVAVSEVVSGAHPWVTIMCKFSDIAAEPNDRAYFVGMYSDTKPGLNHYWKELSFGTANINGSTVGTNWYTLPETELHYNPTDTAKGTNRTLLAQDCIAAADADVDFSLYDGINMMFNSDFDNGWAWGGGWDDTLDGVTKHWSITWEPPWGVADISVLAHEMGHGFGLPHSTANMRDTPNTGPVYDNAWDVMSQDRYNCAAATDPTYGCMAQHTISHHKDLMGWIPGTRKTTVAVGASTTITLEDLAAPASSNYQMVKIPIGGAATHFYTAEARKFTGYDVKLPSEAVIIHDVDTTENQQALLMPAGKNATDLAVRFTAGETFVDATNHIAVRVNSATATGFQVTISNGNLPPTADAGGPYTEECTGLTTTVALDGRGSSDPEGSLLTYAWTTSCDGTFNDSTIAQPILTLNTATTCVVSCTVSLKVTDDQGLMSDSDSAIVTIRDTTPPTIVCPATSIIQCDVSSAPLITGIATATDSCVVTPTVTWTDVTTPGSCPQASTIFRTWKASDNCVNTASCQQNISVVDTIPPVLIGVPSDEIAQCDAVPEPAIVTAADNCDTLVSPSFTETRVDGSCPNSYTLTRTWTGADDCGNTSSSSQIIEVVDTTAPIIESVAAAPNILWSPNHKMVQIAVSATATDNCDSTPVCSITGVSSNEPVDGLGDGDTSPDWVITGDLAVDLRAERSGTGDGRVYTLTVTCTDACGNSSVGNTTVAVPNNQKKK